MVLICPRTEYTIISQVEHTLYLYSYMWTIDKPTTSLSVAIWTVAWIAILLNLVKAPYIIHLANLPVCLLTFPNLLRFLLFTLLNMAAVSPIHLLLSAFPIRGRHSGFSFSSFSYQLYPPLSLQPQPCPLSPHP